jgi:hypothetical protein
VWPSKRLVERDDEKPRTYYSDVYHPERDGGGSLQPGYIRSPAGRFGGSGANRDSHCYARRELCLERSRRGDRGVDANIDTDADRNFWHLYRDADVYCHFYCHADADGDAAPYKHTHCDTNTYRYFYCYANADSDACPTHGHADASVSFLA